MSKHALDTVVAKQHGVNIALLLESFQYWTFKNFTRNHHIYDGLCWTYDTLDSLCDVFPYWTRRQLERVINNAVEVGLLIKGNYNQTKYDRTLWYALTPKSYAYYPDLLEEKYIKALWLSISPNGEMDFTEWRNGFHQTVTPIPCTTPCTDPYIKTKGTSDDEVHNLGHTDFDEGNVRSDYPVNQPESEKNTIQVFEAKGNIAKSDYFENQIKIKPHSNSSIPYDIKKIQEENIFSIPEQAILDWLSNREKKKVPITKTAWKKINKELAKCKEKGIAPIDAFETMVASGWQSLNAQWLHKEKKSEYDDNDTSWIHMEVLG